MINPKIARVWDDYTSSIPLETIEKYPELYGIIIPSSTMNPVRNTKQEFLFFNDAQAFRPAARAFEKSKEEVKGTGLDACYTSALEGTKAYKDFWEQEKLRCLTGYEPVVDGEPCGVRITGEHYFYLNYCLIGKAVKNETTGEDTEELGFPNFTSMDYYWFHELEQAENPPEDKQKENLIMAKARRKGFSYKNAAGAVWKYSFFKNSRVVIAAEYGIKAKQTFDMALNMIDFLNQYTEFRSPWTHRKTGENKCFIRSGVEVEKNGRKYTKGKKSIIETISFHNKPDAAAGIGATRILIEEAGLITDLKRAWKFTEPLLRSGKIRKGIAIAYGTGGDMDGATQDFAEMMTDPESHSFKAYDNIYEEHESRGKSGWFVDDMWFREGAWVEINGIRYEAVDENGNARKWVAEIDLNHERAKLVGKDKDTYNVALSQYCKTLSEAFLVTTGNVFPVAELSARLSVLKTPQGARMAGTKGELVEKGGVVFFKPDIENKLEALDRFPLPKSKKSLEGCVVQFEAPIEVDGKIPESAYIISVDPIGIDSMGGESLVAIICMKTKRYPHLIGHDEIVMSYVGRPKIDPLDTTNWILLKMAKYYNAKVTHENDRNGAFIRNFFIQQREFGRLVRPPSDIIEKFIPNSATSARKTGHSMGSEKLKEIGEIYVKRWLLEGRGLNPVTGLEEKNVDKLCDRGLIEELLSYRRDGNFDRCLVKGTQIKTAEGNKPIEDVTINDLVLTHTGKYQRVTKTTNTTHDTITEINIVGQWQPLICTNDHPILITEQKVRGGNKHWKFNEQAIFKAAEELRPHRDYVFIPKEKTIEYHLTPEEEYLVGWYIGDGYIKDNRISIVFGKTELQQAKAIAGIMDNLSSIHDKNVHHNIKPTATIKDLGNYYRLTKTSPYIASICRRFGGTANNKFLGLNSIEAIVGIIEAEGSLKLKPRVAIEVSMANKQVMEKIRQVLINHGIWSTIRTYKKEPYQRMYKITVSSDFAYKLCAFTDMYKIKDLPRKRYVAIETEEGFFTPVKKVKTYNEPQIVYNCEVENDHTYVSDGFVSHNCMALMGAVLQQEQMIFQMSHEDDEETISATSKFFIERLMYLPSSPTGEQYRKRIKQHERLNT